MYYDDFNLKKRLIGEDMSKILALLKVNNRTNKHVQDVVCGCGGFFFFFFFLCYCLWLQWICLVAGGGNGGWMWWLWYGWVDVVADDARLRKRETERGRIKNDKERIFK